MLVALFLSSLLAAMPEQPGPRDRLLVLVGRHYDTVALYRGGNTDEALRRLNENTVEEQRQIAALIVALIETQKKTEDAEKSSVGSGGIDASARRSAALPPLTNGSVRSANPPPYARWKKTDLWTAGILQMEAALEAIRQRNDNGYDAAMDQTKIADFLLDAFTRFTGQEDHSARAWRRLLGLTLMSHGAFGRAATLLDPECAKTAEDAPLHLACGSAHEALAMVPGDVTLASAAGARRPAPEGNPFEESPTGTRAVAISSPVSAARGIRDNHLKSAQRSLGAVLTSEPHNVEARIRLANTRIMQIDDSKAASLLEPLLLEPLNPREAYLSRLLLSRVRIRAKKFADAATLLEQAAGIMPSGQSAYLGLAHVARQRADVKNASDALQRMMKAPQHPDDPWVTYRLGQYWVPDTLLRELRAQVRE